MLSVASGPDVNRTLELNPRSSWPEVVAQKGRSSTEALTPSADSFLFKPTRTFVSAPRR